MENAVKSQLQALRFGDAQQYKNIAILPLLAPVDGTLQYRTLGDALATSDLTVTETSSAGTVPELLVTNRANKPVLLIDGEELAGAKQNRVLNTTILLKEISETKIPVSCTEQGRWSYTSKSFQESGYIMAYKSRSRKTRSVQCSLQESGSYHSNQGEVWSGIADLQAKAGAPSPTAAMSDVYKARENDLGQCAEIFKVIPGQVGLLAFINGAAVGLDLLSLTAAYGRLHPKLIRSYALEGLLESSQPLPSSNGFSEKAASFIAESVVTEGCQFPSIGYGKDFRYRSRSSAQTSICGAALVHQNEVVHAAFFRLDTPSTMSEQPSTAFAPLRFRRRYYRE